jgi:hypothetical protein
MPRGFSQSVGASVGNGLFAGFSCSWPLARLGATETGIVLNMLWKEYYFDKASVSMIWKRLVFAFPPTIVQIVHTKDEYPPFVVVWTFNRKKLVSRLKQLGFPVEDG